MAKTKKMTESELTSQVQMEMQQSVAYIDGELSEQRRQALQYYNGEQVGDLAILDENRSKVVSHDVSDTVEWILPALLKIFYSGDEVVRFEPQGPEDEEVAKQATEYCNWILNRDNPGFTIVYTLLKDALIQKNGICKVMWVVKETNETRSVEGMDDDTYTLLLALHDHFPFAGRFFLLGMGVFISNILPGSSKDMISEPNTDFSISVKIVLPVLWIIKTIWLVFGRLHA